MARQHCLVIMDLQVAWEQSHLQQAEAAAVEIKVEAMADLVADLVAV